MLKELAIHGGIFTNIEAALEPVRAFLKLYDEYWRIDKPGFGSPAHIRLEWFHEVAWI